MTGAAARRVVTAREGPLWLTAKELPGCLGDLSHPPAGLWLLGDRSVLKHASEGMVAIVGTREASAYGERIATRLASAAARAGLVVVSGLARGVDAAAHRAALSAGGATVAVLGTGADVPYPAGHRTLHGQVLDNGAVISEMEPGRKAFPGCFPRRNRIIAALSRVTVVVEAGFKSGAINTASQALELGRTVAAVPGQMDDPRSAGANLLIRDGAQVITSVEDLLTLCGKAVGSGENSYKASQEEHRGAAALSVDELGILKILGGAEVPVHEVAFISGLSVRRVSEVLLRLELAGFVEGKGAGYRRVEGG